MEIRRGMEFTHDRWLDTDWKPGPGEKYKDAPKARCVVTKVTKTNVFYRDVTNPNEVGGPFYVTLTSFRHRFRDQISQGS
jgi:hypothetical protein